MKLSNLTALALCALFAGTANAARFTCDTITFSDAAEGGNVIGNIQDSNTSTIWETNAGLPHSFNCDFGTVKTIDQICYTAKQADSAGRIKDYQILTSDDGLAWGVPVFLGTFTDSATEQCSVVNVNTRYLRLLVESSYSGGTTTIAEISYESTSVPGSIVTSATSVQPHSVSATITWSAPVTGGAPDDYQIQCKRDTQPDTDYGQAADVVTTNVTVEIQNLLNDLVYDCRGRARNTAGNGAWVTTNLQDFIPSTFADLHRTFFTGSNARIFNTKRRDTLYQDDAGTTPVTTDGQTIERVTDLSTNADHFLNTTAGSKPTWSEQDGATWTKITDQFLAFNTAIDTSGNIAVAVVIIQESGSSPVILTDTNNHALKLTTGTNQNLHFRTGDVNRLVNASGFTFQQCAGCATFLLAQRIASSSNIEWYAATIGSNWAAPTHSSLALIGTVLGTATGNVQFDEIGNGTTGGESPDGHVGFIGIRDALFDNASKRADLYTQLLQWLRK